MTVHDDWTKVIGISFIDDEIVMAPSVTGNNSVHKVKNFKATS